MTLDEIREAVAAIGRVAHDPERAHALQDDLFESVLLEIAQGSGSADPVDLAAEALKVREIQFPRWMA